MPSAVVGTLRVVLAMDSAQFERGVKGFKSSMKGLTSAFAAVDFAGAVNKAVEGASQIADASQRIGISAEAVQKLKFAAEQGGASLDTVATSITRMADTLGGPGGAKALAAVGLTFEQIKGLSPDQTFTTIADAIARIPDPLRQSDAATTLFGRGAAELLPAIKAGFTAIGDQAPLMSNAIVKAGDEGGDKLHKLQLDMENLKAKALLPLVGAFLGLPDSLQVAGAGILAFTPSLETLTLAMISLGGPAGAIAGLKTAAMAVGAFFSGTLPGLFAAGVTFFTTTLPAVFGTVIAFLGPQGLIALAVIALGLVWYKWGDQITALVQKVYQAIKSWLVDKFADVVASIKAKIDAVVGYFRGMYDSVVGNSYVPDMVKGIGREFGRLDGLMVSPARLASNLVSDIFSKLSSKVQDIIGGLFKKIGLDFTHFSSSVLPSFGRSMSQQATSIIGSVKDGLMSGITMGIGQAVNSLIQQGVGALVNWARGGEEGIEVNPKRDAFLSQFGDPSNKGMGGAGNNLAALLTSLTGEPNGGVQFHNLQNASSMVTFAAAVDNIIKLLAAHGVQASRNFHSGGMIGGLGEMNIRALSGEAVLNRAAVVRMGGEAGVNAINSGRGSGAPTFHLYANITVNGAGKNSDQLARELAPKLLRAIGRENVAGTRRQLRVIAGTT